MRVDELWLEKDEERGLGVDRRGPGLRGTEGGRDGADEKEEDEDELADGEKASATAATASLEGCNRDSGGEELYGPDDGPGASNAVKLPDPDPNAEPDPDPDARAAGSVSHSSSSALCIPDRP